MPLVKAFIPDHPCGDSGLRLQGHHAGLLWACQGQAVALSSTGREIQAGPLHTPEGLDSVAATLPRWRRHLRCLCIGFEGDGLDDHGERWHPGFISLLLRESSVR